MKRSNCASIAAWGFLAGVFVVAPVWADLSLETETARLVKPGHFEVSAAAEYQHSSRGDEYAVPLAVQWGVLPRLELLVEPVAYTVIHSKGLPTAKGIGDLEITLQYLISEEQAYVPALAGAAEVRQRTSSVLGGLN